MSRFNGTLCPCIVLSADWVPIGVYYRKHIPYHDLHRARTAIGAIFFSIINRYHTSEGFQMTLQSSYTTTSSGQGTC